MAHGRRTRRAGSPGRYAAGRPGGGGDPEEAATRLAKEGIAAYEAEDYGAALARFSEAYAAYAADPVLLYFLGRSADHLGRGEEAISYYRQYLRAGSDPANEQQVREALRRLEARPGRAGPAVEVRPEAAGAQPGPPAKAEEPPPAPAAEGPSEGSDAGPGVAWWLVGGGAAAAALAAGVVVLLVARDEAAPPEHRLRIKVEGAEGAP